MSGLETSIHVSVVGNFKHVIHPNAIENRPEFSIARAHTHNTTAGKLS